DRHPDALHIGPAGAGHRHQACLALRNLVVARASRLGAVVAESADGQYHQTRIDFSQLLLGKPKAVKDSWPEVLHQYVGPTDQCAKRVPTGLLLEVKRHR